MNAQLQTMIKEVQELSPIEQVELIAAVSQTLQNKYKQFSKNNEFWNPKTLKQLADEQRVLVNKSLSDLVTDFWPKEESIDAFNEFIYKQRLEDRLGG